MTLICQKVKVTSQAGLQLRPAGVLCREAMKFQSLITFSYEGGTANAKSVLSVLGACVRCGDEIELRCEGIDEREAMETILLAVRDGLGE